MNLASDLRTIKRSWIYQTQLQMATLFAMAAAFFIATFSLSVAFELRQILSVWGDAVQMTVYLEDGAAQEQIQELEKGLRGNTDVKDVQYISPSHAVGMFKEQLASFAPDLLSDPEFSQPFPAAYRVRLQAAGNLQKLEALASDILTFEAVEDVTYGQGWVKNYSAFVEGATQLTGVLACIILLSTLLIVGNSIRSSFSNRADEIEVLELLGATRSSIRRPFIMEGAFLGFVASSIALGVNIVLPSMQSYISSTSPLLARVVEAQTATPWWLIFVPVVGIFTGALGSWFAVRKMNTGWSARQRTAT